MDFRIRMRNELAFPGGEFMQIYPGKYSGKHWQDGSLFVFDLAFTLAEGIITEHYKEYDHYDWNDIPIDVGKRITSELRDASTKLKSLSIEHARAELKLPPDSYGRLVDKFLDSYRTEIVEMLRELSDRINEFYDQEEWVCIFGV